MKEKIKQIIKFILDNWIKIAEIGTVIWAINGMYKNLFNKTSLILLNKNSLYRILIGKGINVYFVIILFYFLSTILILYLLKRWEDKIK